jgi:hypothetical protein
MKCRDNGHFEARQEIGDIPAGRTAENSVFVLKADDVETCLVQKFGTPSIFVAYLFSNLIAYCRGIVIGATGVRHGDDAGFQLRSGYRDRSMKIMGKGSDSAAARKMIAYERNTPERTH